MKKMRILSKVFLLSFLVVTAVFVSSTQAAQPISGTAVKTIELRFGGSDNQTSVNAIPQFKYAEMVKEKSKGSLIVKVFLQSLGVEQQLTQSVMEGSVDMGQCSGGNLARFTDAFLITDLPFLFRDYDIGMKALTTPDGLAMIARYEKELGVKHLYINSYGMGRSVQTTAKKMVRVPADLKGLKIRTVSTPMDMATFKAWGANPTPVDWAQMYSAMQQGLVDGTQNSPLNLVPSKHQEVLKYVYCINYQLEFEVNFINRKVFDSLSPEHQKILVDCAAELQDWDWKYKREVLTKERLQELRDFGLVVTFPTMEERVLWESIREKVWNEMAEKFKDKLDMKLAYKFYNSEKK